MDNELLGVTERHVVEKLAAGIRDAANRARAVEADLTSLEDFDWSGQILDPLNKETVVKMLDIVEKLQTQLAFTAIISTVVKIQAENPCKQSPSERGWM